jgi:hypothetical protein
VDAWLRQKQVHHAGSDVLIITGRGNQSPGQIPVVREEVRRVLTLLRRRGVVAAFGEHTPGSFVVRLDSLRALIDSPRRHRSAPPSGGGGHSSAPPALSGLSPETRHQLRALALSSLDALGVRNAGESLVAQEMARQFAALSASLPPVTARERLLREAIDRALEEFGDADR